MKLGIGGLAVGNGGGLGRLARGCLLALAQACPDWELHLFLRSKSDAQKLADECDHASLPLLDQFEAHFPATPLRQRLWLEEYEIPRRFTGFGFDAWLGLDFTLPGRPVAPCEAAVLPDLLPFTQPHSVSWRARLLYRNAVRRALGRKARFICISRTTERKLHELFGPQQPQSSVVYPPLSPRLLTLAAEIEERDTPFQVIGSLNNAANLDSYLLAVGVLGPRKNTGRLVRLHEEIVLQGDYGGSLVLVGGDGRYHSAPLRGDFALKAVGSLVNQGSRAAAVHDLGRVNDMELALLYRNADLLVNLSSEEGFGYPVLEALALGTPALVTAGSSMTEIADCGIAAAEPGAAGSRQSLLAALGALPVLRQEARRFDAGRFSLASIGAQLRAALEDAW